MTLLSDFNPTCPAGGKWYACPAGTSRFVGCCTSDPCSTGCVQGNIQPVHYNSTMHGKIPDASCGTASDFYSCGFGDTFWGCCKSNPCKAVPGPACKAGDLVPSFMERPEQFSAFAPSSTPNPSSGSNKGAVIGGVVGGVVVVAIIIGILIFCCCRRRKRNQQKSEPEGGATASTPMMEQRPEEGFSAQYAPPTYSSPNPNVFQSMAPSKEKPYHQQYQQYQQYASHSAEPQELPAEMGPSSQHRFSELPAESSSSNGQRISEMPAGANRVTAELESPHVSPRPLQTEFSTDLAKQAHQEPKAAPGEGSEKQNLAV
ncbi:hypothetical protein GQ44DRAFT_144179 [Phaeosphaeriaceae sp. PMI808]|nr:hypothetical protein GQ44DRAFT_144179 [Phaeosphaeriaceae sp. PMI808]